MRSVCLVGGGWNADAAPGLYGPFLDDAGVAPVVACVLLDEGDGADHFQRWAAVLRAAAICEPVPVLVPPGDTAAMAELGDADALLVGGGLTPGYAAALAPVAAQIRTWLAERDRPYAGFSAGAAVAATLALVGGWQDQGVAVCPDDAAEDLDELSVVPGLGLVDCLVDVHCAQWGTLPRLIAAVERSAGGRGIAIDEDTAVRLADGVATVAGIGAVREATRAVDGVTIRTHRSSGRFQLP